MYTKTTIQTWLGENFQEKEMDEKFQEEKILQLAL